MVAASMLWNRSWDYRSWDYCSDSGAYAMKPFTLSLSLSLTLTLTLVCCGTIYAGFLSPVVHIETKYFSGTGEADTVARLKLTALACRKQYLHWGA